MAWYVTPSDSLIVDELLGGNCESMMANGLQGGLCVGYAMLGCGEMQHGRYEGAAAMHL